MQRKTAEQLTRVDIYSLSLEQLQKHRVRLIDAWRESQAEHGFVQAVRDGFYVPVLDDAAAGFSPCNVWLTENLNFQIERATKRENELFYSA